MQMAEEASAGLHFGTSHTTIMCACINYNINLPKLKQFIEDSNFLIVEFIHPRFTSQRSRINPNIGCKLCTQHASSENQKSETQV